MSKIPLANCVTSTKTKKDGTSFIQKKEIPENMIPVDLTGLKPGQYTLEEVGIMLGITRERARQIESAALKKLQHPRLRKKWEAIRENLEYAGYKTLNEFYRDGRRSIPLDIDTTNSGIVKSISSISKKEAITLLGEEEVNKMLELNSNCFEVAA